MKAGLSFKLSQSLALTPQLQQSIRLLQLSTLELQQEIAQQLADNPLLELEDHGHLPDSLDSGLRIGADGHLVQSAPSSTLEDQGIERDADGQALDGAESANEQARQDSLQDTLNADYVNDWSGSKHSADDEDCQIQTAAPNANLTEHLLAQARLLPLSHFDHAVLHYLIDALDRNGYLQEDVQTIAFDLAQSGVRAPHEEIEEDSASGITQTVQALESSVRRNLHLLQSMDPPGIGACNAAQCLQLQLQHHLRHETFDDVPPQLFTVAQRMVEHCLAQLASRDYNGIKKTLAINDDQLRAAQALILRLDPHPGAAYEQEAADYVVPDVIVRKVRNQWTAMLNTHLMPRLRVNEVYAQALKGHKGSTDLNTRLQEARWLIKNVQQRFETILRVSQAIVNEQKGFFTHGHIAMRPLVLREIADTLGLHESTISRVTTQKFMATPHGVFELKYFFGSHVATDAGGAASSTAIRALIKQLLANEDSKKPLSDSQIAKLLTDQGILVARRTVAKYREAMKIPPVALRKTL